MSKAAEVRFLLSNEISTKAQPRSDFGGLTYPEDIVSPDETDSENGRQLGLHLKPVGNSKVDTA